MDLLKKTEKILNDLNFMNSLSPFGILLHKEYINGVEIFMCIFSLGSLVKTNLFIKSFKSCSTLYKGTVVTLDESPIDCPLIIIYNEF
jgi:hypothetical protein